MELKSYQEIKAYFEGKRAGVTLYAWWKEGTQYVGTTGTTLWEARAKLTNLENDTLQTFSEGKTIYAN